MYKSTRDEKVVKTSENIPLSNDLISVSFPASSSFRKSLVFCARSLRWTSESRWWATRSEAAVSRVGMRLVRSMSVSHCQRCHMSCEEVATTYSSMPLWLSGTCCLSIARCRRYRRRPRSSSSCPLEGYARLLWPRPSFWGGGCVYQAASVVMGGAIAYD